MRSNHCKRLILKIKEKLQNVLFINKKIKKKKLNASQVTASLFTLSELFMFRMFGIYFPHKLFLINIYPRSTILVKEYFQKSFSKLFTHPIKFSFFKAKNAYRIRSDAFRIFKFACKKIDVQTSKNFSRL